MRNHSENLQLTSDVGSFNKRKAASLQKIIRTKYVRRRTDQLMVVGYCADV